MVQQQLVKKRFEVVTPILKKIKCRTKRKQNIYLFIVIESIRSLRLQGKLPPWNIERQANQERHSQEFLAWSRSHRNHKCVGIFTWWFGWVVRSWAWISMTKENPAAKVLGWAPYFASPQCFQGEYPEKIPIWLWQRKRKCNYCQILPGLFL